MKPKDRKKGDFAPYGRVILLAALAVILLNSVAVILLIWDANSIVGQG